MEGKRKKYSTEKGRENTENMAEREGKKDADQAEPKKTKEMAERKV